MSDYQYYQGRLIEGSITVEEAKKFLSILSKFDPYRSERERELKRIITECGEDKNE